MYLYLRSNSQIRNSLTNQKPLPSQRNFFFCVPPRLLSPVHTSSSLGIGEKEREREKESLGREQLCHSECSAAAAAAAAAISAFEKHALVGCRSLFFFCMRASVRFFLSLAPRWLNFFAMRAAAAVAVLLAWKMVPLCLVKETWNSNNRVQLMVAFKERKKKKWNLLFLVETF